ncbi:MAG: hypothetical protein IPM13_04535 [Phycisphaerales bacterium]|nr:hypothetical protein [Phycisphaerales bacterium]
MSTLLRAGWLLAEFGWREELATFRESQVGNSVPLHWQIILIVTMVASIFAFFGLWTRLRSRERNQAQAVDDAYVRQAAAVLSLSGQTVRDLKRLAKTAGVSQPVALLLSPNNLLWAMRAAQQEAADAGLVARVDRLCHQLFGLSLQEADATARAALTADAAPARPPDDDRAP